MNRLREKLDRFIGEHPDYGLVRMLLSGSLAKGMALKTLNEIDVALYVKTSEAPQNEPDLLIWIAECLRKAYPQMAPEQIRPPTAFGYRSRGPASTWTCRRCTTTAMLA